MVVPRVPASNFNPVVLNWFLGRPCGNRRARIVLKYADGSSDTIYRKDWSYSDSGFEFVFNRPSPVEKDVVQASLELCQMDGQCKDPAGDGCKVLMVFNGNTDNPVFKSGDVVQFKIVFKNTVNIG